MVEDLDKIAWTQRNLGDMMSSDADVVVSDVHYFVRPMIPFIPKDPLGVRDDAKPDLSRPVRQISQAEAGYCSGN